MITGRIEKPANKMHSEKILELLCLDQLMALSLEFHAVPVMAKQQPYLLVDLSSACSQPDYNSQGLGRWLQRQAVPVIGYLSDAKTPNDMLEYVDLVVDRVIDLDRITANIAENPVSSMVLIQVLRSTEGMDVQQALTVESLAYSTLQSGTEFTTWLEQFRESNRRSIENTTLPDHSPPVLLSREAAVLNIRLNRPGNHNALSVEMRDGLFEAFQLLEMDSSIKMARVSGLGACFSTGGDLLEFGSFANPADAHRVRTLSLPSRVLAEHVDRVEFNLHGACIGSGIEIPAFASHVTARRKTFFQLPEVSLGLIPGAGGCVSIPRRIGRQRTAYFALYGKRINARTALEWGLIDAIVD